MKKLYTVFAVVLATTVSVYAQPAFNPIEKGNKQIGLQMLLAPTDMYSSETDLSISDDEKTYGLHVAGSYGWFLERGWILGLQTNLGFYHNEYNTKEPWGYNEDAFDVSIAPMTRYYFTVDKKHRFKPFLFAGIPVVYTSRKTDYNNQNSMDYDENTVELRGSFGVGAAYFGRSGSIEMNVSNMGLYLGVNKFIQWKAKSKG